MAFRLAEDQLKAFDTALSHRCVFITGPAGTGKSVLIKELTCYYESEATKVHLCSSTGVSAYLIGGMTVHAFIRLIDMADNLTPEDVIIIDEISMLGRTVFEELDEAIRDYYKKKGYPYAMPFGGNRLILVGDFAQLPPVNDSFCFTSKLWSYVEEEVELKEIKRQTEKEFAEFLLRVRSGRLSTSDRKRIYQYQSRPILPDSIQLYTTNEKARAFNNRKLSECSKQSKKPITTFTAQIQEGSNFTPREIEDFMKAQTARFYEELQICVGARVLLTSNLSVENGWVNGSLCLVEDTLDNNLIVLSRMVDGKKVMLSIEREKYMRTKKVITSSSPCNYVVGRKMCGKIHCQEHAEVIYSDRDGTDNDLSNIKDGLVVSQFPLLLAWAMTIHKAQGSTLESCTVHLSTMKYTPSLFYVGISRCKFEDGLCIRSEGPIQYDQICPDETILERVFNVEERKCGLCEDLYVGPYKVCQDCSSAPGGFSMKCFKDFVDRPTEEMLNYVEFALSHKDYSSGKKWKKFVRYLEKEYRIKS